MELNEETFTIQDLKRLLKEAFDFDYEKHKGKVKFLPLTIVEWHKSDIFKNELSLDDIKYNIEIRYLPFNVGGAYFFNQKSFVIFFQRTETIKLLECREKTLEELLVYCVLATFHELLHYYQHILDKREGVNLFSYKICEFVENFNRQDYKVCHDRYWNEIEAHLYGVERAYEFLEKKGMLTKEIEKILQKYQNRFLFDLSNFDIHYFLHECHKIVKENNWLLPSYYQFLSLFYNDNRRFRSINKILKLAEERNLDNQILMLFFSSKDFLESLNFIFLSKKSKQVVISAIEYALEIEINRRKKNKEFLQNKGITAKQYLKVDVEICSKIAYFNKKLDEIRRTMNLINVNENQEDLENKRR